MRWRATPARRSPIAVTPRWWGGPKRDENLAEKVGLRLDLPANLLRELLGKVADVVLARFLTGAAAGCEGQNRSARCHRRTAAPARPKIDYAAVYAELDVLNRTGKLNDQAVNRFAVRGEYVNVVAALALKADARPEAIEMMLAPRATVWADRGLQGRPAELVDHDDDRPQPPRLPGTDQA